MSLLTRLESRLARWAIPHSLLFLGMIQAVVFLLGFLTRSPDGSPSPLLLQLGLDRTAVEQGDYWRLGTFLLLPGFAPRGFLSILFMYFTVSIMALVGRALEGAWSAIRVNFFVLIAGLSLGLANWFLGSGGFFIESSMLYASLFLAFAAVMPNYELMLYGIIPVKAKWLGWLTAAGLAYSLIYSPGIRWSVIAALVPYCLYVVPGFFSDWQQNRATAVRRRKFEDAKLSEDEAFHRCALCAKTDQTDPHAEFRVLEDEREVCTACLASQEKPAS